MTKEQAIKTLIDLKGQIIIKKEEMIRELWRLETQENNINEKLKKYGKEIERKEVGQIPERNNCAGNCNDPWIDAVM